MPMLNEFKLRILTTVVMVALIIVSVKIPG